MKVMVEGPLFETAQECLLRYGYNLTTLAWEPKTDRMSIDYSHTGSTISLIVRGLPEDIPMEIFDKLVENLVKRELRGQSKATVDSDVIVWLKRYKLEKTKMKG